MIVGAARRHDRHVRIGDDGADPFERIEAAVRLRPPAEADRSDRSARSDRSERSTVLRLRRRATARWSRVGEAARTERFERLERPERSERLERSDAVAVPASASPTSRSSWSIGMTSISANPSSRSCDANALALPTSTIDRRSGLTYCRATRWMSSGVTACTRSRNGADLRDRQVVEHAR